MSMDLSAIYAEQRQAANNLCNWIVEFLEDNKATDILHLDLENKVDFAYYAIIASCSSDRHIRAVTEKLSLQAKDSGLAYKIEGKSVAEWVIIDFGTVVVHIFLPATRERYQLEQIYA